MKDCLVISGCCVICGNNTTATPTPYHSVTTQQGRPTRFFEGLLATYKRRHFQTSQSLATTVALCSALWAADVVGYNDALNQCMLPSNKSFLLFYVSLFLQYMALTSHSLTFHQFRSLGIFIWVISVRRSTVNKSRDKGGACCSGSGCHGCTITNTCHYTFMTLD